MRFFYGAALAAVSLSLVSCGAPAQELTQTASGTWMSPRIQGEKQVILSTATAQVDDGVISLTVMDLTTSFLPEGELLKRPSDMDSQIVRVGMKAANVGTKDALFAYDSLHIQLKNGTEGRISYFINNANASDFLQSKALQPGESVEGAVYFEVPATAVREDLILEYRANKTVALPLIK